MRRLIAKGAAIIALSGGTLAAAAPALASTLPKIQRDEFGTWHRGWQVRPLGIVFGSYFEIYRLHYLYYSRRSALAHGRLVYSTCNPDCAEGSYAASATARFWDVFDHAGPGRNFGYLRITWYHHGHHTKVLWIDSHGQWWWAALGAPPGSMAQIAEL